MQQSIQSFHRVLVANRGEIAIRVFRALNELGIQTIAVYSKEDKYSLFRTKADESYMLDPDKGPVDAYLDIANIVRIAKENHVDAIHPGYGLLSENPDFVRACTAAGIVFIGPSAELMDAMGDKISSKKMAIEANVPIIPGVDREIHTEEDLLKAAAVVGYPLLLKASNGGGGRGMRIVDNEADLLLAFAQAKRESIKAFGGDKIFVEKYLRGPKHIEVQVLADNYGNVVHLYDRDCSVQRRHQKVVEFAPAFTIPDSTRQIIFDSAIRLCKKVGYRNAGTLEFLVDAEANPYFIEMNPRIQVEHTVTEEVTGIDIVQSQILIAEGYRLDSPELALPDQSAVHCSGYSIQTRITTESPCQDFMPDTGRVNVYRSGSGSGIRIDGGNCYQGAQILPYYDSLLVKLISHSRTFAGAIAKSLRAVREIRIRGVKTNTPFLIKVLENPLFVAGKCTTTFIEDTPELFQMELGQDRASRLIEFIGDKIVNAETPKGMYHDRILPRYDTAAPVHGARDEFLALGARGYTQKILRDKKLYITDTTMRDAQQSLMATRMRTKDLAGAMRAENAIMANAFSVEAWGGATFDTAYRFLKESPWERLKAFRTRMPNTLIQMLLRASNAVGYSNYPDNVVQEFIRVSARQGVDVFRIFDSLNWVENMKLPIATALETGKIVEGTICYTGDLSSPEETKYTLDYYLTKAKELETLGVHIFAIKDMAGLLKPYAARVLFTALKKELSIPVHLHTHDTTGNGVATVLMAAEAGVDIVDCALESMSSLTSQPSLNSVVAALHGTERDTGLDPDLLSELSHYFERQRQLYKPFESGINAPISEIYKYEIPGGQYSNLYAQVTSMGSGSDFEQIKHLYYDANRLLGNIVKVTPSSKVVGDLAIFMSKNGLTAENILTAGKDLAFPDSVVSYFKGMIGQPEGGFPAELQKIVLKGETPITVRPGSLLAPVDFDAIKKHLTETYGSWSEPLECACLSWALYGKVYDEYLDHQRQYSDVDHLESHVYFHGLRKGEETQLSLAPGKDLLIRYLEMSEPDAEGYRTLEFQVNGATRTARVLDRRQAVKVVSRPKAEKDNPEQIGSSIPGTVEKILVQPGDVVKVNTPVMVVEAMKMETTIVSRIDGIVEKYYVQPGDKVASGDLLVSFKAIQQ